MRRSNADQVFDRAVEVTVSWVRQNLKGDQHQPEYLKTVRQVDYLLAPFP